MPPLRLTEPFPTLWGVRPAINLQEMLDAQPGTVLTSYVHEAAPGVFGPLQTWTARFLHIERIYYFFWENELEDIPDGAPPEAFASHLHTHGDVASPCRRRSPPPQVEVFCLY